MRNNNIEAKLEQGLYLINVEMIELGRRDKSVYRSKRIEYDNKDLNHIYKTLDVELKKKNRVTSPVTGGRLNQNRYGTERITNATGSVDIINGWQTSRYYAILTFGKILSKNRSEVSVIEGFTEHGDVLNVKHDRVIYDPKGRIYINRISIFSGNGQCMNLRPKTQFIVIADRKFGGRKPPRFIQSSSNIFNSLDDGELMDKGLQTNDSTMVVGDVDAISGTQSLNQGLTTNIANGAIHGALSNDIDNYNAVASMRTNTHSVFGCDVVSAITKFYTDIDRMLNPHSFEFDMLEAYMPDLSTKMHVFKNNGDDTRYVEIKNGEQLPLDKNTAEVKLSTVIAEAATSIFIKNNIKTISGMITGIPYGDKNKFEIFQKSKLIFNGVTDFITPGLNRRTCNDLLNSVHIDLSNEIESIMSQYNGNYMIDITMYGLSLVEVLLSIGGGKTIATTHNMYAQSLHSTSLATKEDFQDNTASVYGLTKELRKTARAMKRAPRRLLLTQ